MPEDSFPSSQPAPAENRPQVIVQPQQTMFGRYGRWLLVALGIAVMIIISMAGSLQSYFNTATGPQEKYHSLSKTATDKIAIISVEGTLLEGDGFIKKQIDRVQGDDNVVAVVLRINSPGGTITASDFIYHYLRELVDEREIPLVVSMDSLCASGGYYIAMAVGDEPDSIFAEPTTWTGSIGVIIPHYDLSGLLKRYDVTEDSITSGPLKQMGSPMKPMTAKEREILQVLVDDSFADFKQIVMNGRPEFKEDPAKLDAVATGQIFTAKQALDRGLVDKLGFIEVAIERAAELAGKDTDKVRCVKYTRPQTAIDALMSAETPLSRRGSVDLAALLDLSAPRAYYLYTWLPALLTNSSQ